VRDEGHGMDRDTQSRMFEPLFTTRAPDAGRGLGLSTVWGIVTQAGGHLRVRSAPGAGTTVEVWLPRAPVQTPPRAMGAVPGPATAAQGQTILLVEDEPAVRTSVRRILERAGYRVLEARNGVDGRLTWEAHRDDVALVLTDVMMPEADGAELAIALRAQAPDVRLVFMSGYPGEEASVAERLGAEALVVEKPFEARILLERVRQALDG
jgi:CheY-like chemotaxis protein